MHNLATVKHNVPTPETLNLFNIQVRNDVLEFIEVRHIALSQFHSYKSMLIIPIGTFTGSNINSTHGRTEIS